jgi:hypothetical protein
MKLCFGFFLLLVSAINQVSAATVDYTQDRRYTWSAGSDGDAYHYSDYYYPGAPYADANIPGQTSSLGGNGFSATGSGSTYSNYGWSSLESIFDITFSVANGTTMTMSGQLQGQDEYYGSGNASLFLYRGDNVLAANQLYGNGISAQDDGSNNGYESAAISYSALLSAGEYRLVAMANPYFQMATSSFVINASFTPAPVPLPAAVWLLGSGLLGLMGCVKRRRPAAG